MIFISRLDISQKNFNKDLPSLLNMIACNDYKDTSFIIEIIQPH